MPTTAYLSSPNLILSRSVLFSMINIEKNRFAFAEIKLIADIQCQLMRIGICPILIQVYTRVRYYLSRMGGDFVISYIFLVSQ